MAYQLQSTEPLPDQVRRIASEEINFAIKQLASGKDREKAVHEARKSIKKIRGLLRLVQGELGKAYRTENVRFRNMGRKLSQLRDAVATVEMFERLISEYGHSISKADLAAIRRGFAAGKAETEKKLGLAETARDMVVSLRSAGKRIDSWPLRSGDFTAVAGGLKKSYSRGRKAMASAAADPTAANLHQWRKRAKDQRYHMRLLTGVSPDYMEVLEKNLHELESWLGDHHNLAVMSAQVEANPERFGGEVPVSEFLHLAKRASETLRDKAFGLGDKLYRQKPKKFVAKIEELWNEWQQTSLRKSPSSGASSKTKRTAA